MNNITHAIKGVIVGAATFTASVSAGYADGAMHVPEWWGAGSAALTALLGYIGVAVAAPAYTQRQAGKNAEPVDVTATEGMPVE